MKNKNVAVKQKNKGLSSFIIIMSCVFFVASGVLIFLSLYEGKAPLAEQSVAAGIGNAGQNSVQTITPQEDINPAFNEALLSVVLDKYNVRTTDSLKAQTCVVNTSDSMGLLESYTSYLDSLSVDGIRYNLLHGDYDNDGATEYYLFVYFPVEATFNALGNSQAYVDYKNNGGKSNDSQAIVIYGDTHNGQTTFRTYYSGLNYYDEHNISVNNGVLNVSHGTLVDEIYVVCTPYVVYDN